MDNGGSFWRRALARTEPLFVPVRFGVYALAGVSGLGVLVMMGVTCADVVLRIFGRSLTGAVDLVTLAGAVSVACALPYTTAVKGHVAIEYFFHKLRRRGRVIVDSIARVVTMGMFVVVCIECVRYGQKLHEHHEVSMTLKLPVFWIPYVVAFAAAMVVLVILCHLLHPGKEMIKP